MKYSGSNGNPALDIEGFLNQLIQSLFPAWYAQHAARELPLKPMGVINPGSFLCHRWLSLHSVCKSLADSLLAHDQEWKPLAELLGKLISERELQRPLSITAIDGLEQSQYEQDWPTLLSWAEHHAGDLKFESAEDFDLNVRDAFPDANKPHRMVYREWDGRYYWINPSEPQSLAAALLYAQQKQRSSNITATISIESINHRALDRIRSEYWLLLMERDSAYSLFDLVQRASLPAVMGEFEWRRSDLVFLVGKKNNSKLNQVMLNLMNNRSSHNVLEFGRWLSRQNYPFRNQ